MKIEILAGMLLKTLATLIGATSTKTTPVLANVHIDADSKGNVTFTTTDMEVELVSTIQTHVIDEGICLAPAKKLLDIARGLSRDAEITLEFASDTLYVKSGRSRFKLSTVPAADWPANQQQNAEIFVTVPDNELKNLLRTTESAMAISDVRYYLNGLYLEILPDQLRAVATDGHRMSVCHINGQFGENSGRNAIIPRKGISLLTRLLGNEGQPIKMSLSATQVSFEMPHITLTSNLIEGKFPDWQRVIPDSNPFTLRVEREEMMKVIQRVAIMSNADTQAVAINVSQGKVDISAQNSEKEFSHDSMQATYDGEPIEIGFNAQYILEALDSSASDECTFTLGDGNKATALKPLEDSAGTLHVLMPIRL